MKTSRALLNRISIDNTKSEYDLYEFNPSMSVFVPEEEQLSLPLETIRETQDKLVRKNSDAR